MFVDQRELTDSERSYLARHNIDASRIYDARRQPVRTWQEAAQKARASFVVSNPCRNGGHRIKTRGNHCIACRPASIAFMKRESADGHVYLAHSALGKCVKVGFSKDVWARQESLNRERYGSLNDWNILCAIRSPRAAELERAIADMFRHRTHYRGYSKDGRIQVASEIFSVAARPARTMFLELATGLGAKVLIP